MFKKCLLYMLRYSSPLYITFLYVTLLAALISLSFGIHVVYGVEFTITEVESCNEKVCEVYGEMDNGKTIHVSTDYGSATMKDVRDDVHTANAKTLFFSTIYRDAIPKDGQ